MCVALWEGAETQRDESVIFRASADGRSVASVRFPGMNLVWYVSDWVGGTVRVLRLSSGDGITETSKIKKGSQTNWEIFNPLLEGAVLPE